MTLQKVVVKPIPFHHLRCLAPSSPLEQPSHLPYKLFQFHFSLFTLFLMIFPKMCSRCNKKHISYCRHRTCLIEYFIFLTSKPNRARFDDDFQPHRSGVCSFPLLFPPCHLSCNSILKNTRTYLYHCYRWLPWTFLMMYPTPY